MQNILKSENSKKRDECAKEALDDMIKFLKENNGDVIIFIKK